jgi:hypothetical protein
MIDVTYYWALLARAVSNRKLAARYPAGSSLRQLHCHMAQQWLDHCRNYRQGAPW